ADEERAHDPRDGPGRAHERGGAVREVERVREERREAREEVEEREQRAAKRVFDERSREEEEQHVAEEMQPPAVDEDGGERRPGTGRRGHVAERVVGRVPPGGEELLRERLQLLLLAGENLRFGERALALVLFPGLLEPLQELLVPERRE